MTTTQEAPNSSKADQTDSIVPHPQVRIHETAEVSAGAQVGPGTSIWNHSQVREGSKIGSECIVGKNVYIDAGAKIGDRCKIQNNVSVFHGVIIEDGVFVGPHVCFTNDKLPRAINSDGTLKAADDWEISEILVRTGAALGANSTILPGVTIGRWAMVGSGSVVTKDVADHDLVVGNPARRVASVCACGQILRDTALGERFEGNCPSCAASVSIK